MGRVLVVLVLVPVRDVALVRVTSLVAAAARAGVVQVALLVASLRVVLPLATRGLIALVLGLVALVLGLVALVLGLVALVPVIPRTAAFVVPSLLGGRQPLRDEFRRPVGVLVRRSVSLVRLVLVLVVGTVSSLVGVLVLVFVSGFAALPSDSVITSPSGLTGDGLSLGMGLLWRRSVTGRLFGPVLSLGSSLQVGPLLLLVSARRPGMAARRVVLLASAASQFLLAALVVVLFVPLLVLVTLLLHPLASLLVLSPLVRRRPVRTRITPTWLGARPLA